MFFYSHLFLSHPAVRELFPVAMTSQRDKLVGALGRIVSSVDELDSLVPYLQQLGRDHRRFNAVAAHYPAVGASLLATLQHFLGPQWTDGVAHAWSDAYNLVAMTMVQAAEEAGQTPASWIAEVRSVERRTLDVAVLQIQPDSQYDFVPGQSFALEAEGRPKLWRYYSPANAPRPDGSIELHVQLIPGGQVSSYLLQATKPGDKLRIGSPIGTRLILEEDEKRDLLLVAGGTGLAPLRAVLEQVDRRWQSTGAGPQVHLYHGVRMPWNLYERDLMRVLKSRPWFDYVEVVSDDVTFPGEKGLIGSVAARHGYWRDRLAMVCGSEPMVRHTVGELSAAGMQSHDICFEEFNSIPSPNDKNQQMFVEAGERR